MFFEDNEIGVRNLLVKDINEHEAVFNGGIFHDGFRNFVVDLSSKFENFQMLNTGAGSGELYYGTAYATGEFTVLGVPTNLYIDVTATTNKDTRIFIPVGGISGGVEQKDFINFISLRDSANLFIADVDTVSRVNLEGINMDFDLDVTNDAYCEIIFDIKSGDIIRGRGNGKINLQIDTKGEFNMFGNYEIEEGGYNFTLYNIINKEFSIDPGSRISWYGDPYQGVMDIQARYNQLASMAPLLDNSLIASHPDVRRRYPSEVLLDLKGELLAPTIGFDIEVSEFPDNIQVDGVPFSLQTAYDAFKFKIATDEQELKRQVFSLIILRRFSEINAFRVSGSSTLGNSVSEFISNQLSYWITQFDENLEIDVDLSGLDEDAFNTFQLRLSYTFLDGRLRITRDGGFTNVDNEADISSIAGDWTLEYLLTSDGKFRVKMYNRNNYNQLNSGLDNNQNTNSAGFSVIYTRSFDEWVELIKGERQKQLIMQKPAATPND